MRQRPDATAACRRGAAAALLSLAAAVGCAADGMLDPSFGNGGKVVTDFDRSTDIAYAVARQADGKLVVVGTTYVNNDYTDEDFALARYQPDGTLDATFGTGGKVRTDFPGLAAVASAVAIQPDGKIVVAGGAFPLFTFLGDFRLARYHPNGALDTSFGDGGIVTTRFARGSYANALVLLPDGGIVAAGTHFVNFTFDDSADTDFALARYRADGTLDPTFGSGGTVSTDFDRLGDDAYAILLQPDGKLVAVGSARTRSTSADFAAARYLPGGGLDATFGVGGRVRTDFGLSGFDQARAAALQPDGAIVAAGTTNAPSGLEQRFALARWRADGVRDRTFHHDGRQTIDFGSFSQTAHQVLLQPDGRIVTVGYADTEAADSDFLLARCRADGTLDPTFGVAGKVRTSFGDLNGGAKGALLQPDGRIVAVGFQATNTARFAEFALARYLAGTAEHAR